MKLAVVLFNLGGPDCPQAIRPFLENLFSDAAIVPLPGFLRRPLAKGIARWRAPAAEAIYAQIGGRSPILAQTSAQAAALEHELGARGVAARVFVAMRAWTPLSGETARAVKAWSPERIVLLPLYPQYSTTTSASSLAAWNQAARAAGLCAPHNRVCCYPWEEGFVAAAAELTGTALAKRKPSISYRILFSAHGLPQRTIAQGDPYRWQVERSAEAIAKVLALDDCDWRVCYQSRVGPLRWLDPATDAEIARAGAEGKGVIVVPIAFVSEHSETLVELDRDYATLARESGVPDYLRVPAVGAHPHFVGALAGLVLRAADTSEPVTCGEGRLCPRSMARCGFAMEAA